MNLKLEMINQLQFSRNEVQIPYMYISQMNSNIAHIHSIIMYILVSFFFT